MKKFIAAALILMATLFLFQGFDNTARFVDDYDGQWSEFGKLNGLVYTDGHLTTSGGASQGEFQGDLREKGEILRMNEVLIDAANSLDSGDNVTVRTYTADRNLLEENTFEIEPGLNTYDITTLNETAVFYEVDVQLTGQTQINDFEVSGTIQGGQGFGAGINELFIALLLMMAVFIVFK